MKITPYVFSLPPYISTTWQQVAALHVQQDDGIPVLIVDLFNGNRIEIPGLDPDILERIFSMHTAFNESCGDGSERLSDNALKGDLSSLLSLHIPSKFLGESIEKMAGALQHNPDAADTADLPQEILDKAATIAQSLGIEDASSVPSATEGCNCLFCQIARTMHAQITVVANSAAPAEEQIEEVISEEDLQFKTWDIHQKDGQLYEVVNPLDAHEHYSVFLGTPVGCTCGSRHCEHIRAVLRS